MASEGDQYVVDQALEPQNNDPLFQAKRYAYIQDTANTGGRFSGQMKFDLNTLSSQAQWVDLAEGRIEFPIRITITSTAQITGNGWQPTLNVATIKNGFHQFVDQVQVELSSTTLQTSQIFTNIDTTFKMLTEWSREEWEKYAPSLGLGLDEWTNVKATDSSLGSSDSLDNAALLTTANAPRGFDITSGTNPGLKSRLEMFNNSSASGVLGKSILQAKTQEAQKSNVVRSAVNAETPAGGCVFAFYALAIVRLKDVSDIVSKLPPIKNCRGFITVSYNSSEHVQTVGPLAMSNRNLYGRCAPCTIDSAAPASGVDTNAFTMRAEVAGEAVTVVNAGATQSGGPITTTARLVCPYYVANPTIDRALSQKKTLRYVERFVTEFSLQANGSENVTLSPGIRNPKKLILYPYFTGAGTSGNTGFIENPLLSPVDGCPATTSPFAALNKMQVIVGGQPMFQTPVSSDYEFFLQEVSKTGLDGGLNIQQGTGILDQRLWNQLYRYHCVDIGRRLGGDDGSSKAVQVSVTNGTHCPMRVIAMIHYEREIILDTATGMVSQMM